MTCGITQVDQGYVYLESRRKMGTKTKLDEYKENYTSADPSQTVESQRRENLGRSQIFIKDILFT